MNTIGTQTLGSSWRAKYFSSNLQTVLRKALVCEKICQVDNSDLKYIHNPFTTQPTAAIQAVAGTYSVSAWSVTEDSLLVNDEVIYGGHIFQFEEIMNNFNLMAARMDEMAYSVAYGIDYFVLNNLCEDGTGTYTTPVGGFTTASNINEIMANLISKVSGFQDVSNGMFLVIENTDMVGFVQAQATNGFSFADMALKNGFMSSYMGVDIYVVRTGTFVTATIGSTSVTNASHRVFGVKNVATYASPRGIQYDEKGVSGKTGKEVSAQGLVGFKLWTQKASLVIDITLA